MSIKLTDTQLVLLGSAAQRKDLCLVAPPTLKGGAAQKVARKLISAGFIKEVKAKASDPIWRRDEESGASYALKLTAAGAKAIAVDNAAEPEDAGEKSDALANRDQAAILSKLDAKDARPAEDIILGVAGDIGPGQSLGVKLGHSLGKLLPEQQMPIGKERPRRIEFQVSTNFPLVRIANNATGDVSYARTYNFSTIAVATGDAIVSTWFDVPTNIETGPSELVVVANGIPSLPIPIIVAPGGALTQN
jgi:hypothetical protein